MLMDGLVEGWGSITVEKAKRSENERDWDGYDVFIRRGYKEDDRAEADFNEHSIRKAALALLKVTDDRLLPEWIL